MAAFGDGLRRFNDEVNTLSELMSPCPLIVGFLFKRKCGRLTRIGCTYCKGEELPEGQDTWDSEADPYFADRLHFPGFSNYGWWASSNRHRTLANDFSDADGAILMNDDDDDLDFEDRLDVS